MPFVGIGNILGGGSAKISYAKQLAKAYAARVIADGGVVESLGCFTAFATALGASKPNFDADYQAVLNYATTQGYNLPTYSQRLKQNQLLLDLKAGGIWSKLDSFRVYATDGDSSYALIDWKRLVMCTAVNSPTFTTNVGYRGNGTSAYINSNYNPTANAVNYSLNSASIFAYISSVRTVGQIQAYQGQFSGSSYLLFAAGTNVIGETYINSVTGVTNGLTGVGFQLVNRLDATTLNVYYQGVLRNTNSSASVSGSLPNATIWDFGANNGGAGTFFSDVGNAIMGYGANLNAEQSDFNTAVNNYINSL
jgi:hypothetical protein